LLAADVLLFGQDFTHSPCVDPIVGGNVVLMLPAPMAEPNVNGFIVGKLSFFQSSLLLRGAQALDLML
jgi:hypothetical protein